MVTMDISGIAGCRLLANVEGVNLRALGGEHVDDGPPNSAAAACHHADLSVELSHSSPSRGEPGNAVDASI